MARRRGLSISLKMIITTTLLVLIIVFLFGFLSILSVQDIYDDQAKRQAKIYRTSTRERGASKIEDLSQGVAALMKEQEYRKLQALLEKARTNDPLVERIWLLDDKGRRVASSDADDNKRFNTQWAQSSASVTAFTHPLIPANYEKLLATTRKAAAPMATMGARVSPGPTIGPKPMAAMTTGTSGAANVQGGLYSKTAQYEGTQVIVVGKLLAADTAAGEVKLGAMFIIYSLAKLKQRIAEINRRKEKAFSRSWQYTAMVGGVFILVGLLLAIFQGLQISRPIKILTTRASQIAQGDLKTRVDLVGGGELGVLGENFNFMADQLLILLQQTATTAQKQKELDVARDIQETLVPPSEQIVDRPFLRLAGYFEPASECGGDWWTYHELADGRILVVIADVTGHGVPSAMITATAKSAVDTLRAVTHDDLTVTYLLEILNRAILESAKRKFVMTCFASIIDPKSNKITFANAGHNFPYIMRQENGRAKFNVLMTRGNRLGDILDSTYDAKEEELRPGDVLIWYTDGVVECESEMGEEYGEKRFRNSIRRMSDEEPDTIRDEIMRQAQAFYGEMPHKDDITMVIGKFYEPGTAPPLRQHPGVGEVEDEVTQPGGAPEFTAEGETAEEKRA